MTHSKIQTDQAWQLQVFHKSLKKQLKVKELFKFLGDVSGQECLLLTCGDNNGAINWYFRENGGNWTWGDVMSENLGQIVDLLGEPVYHILPDNVPFEEDTFDCIVLLDVLEHLEEDQKILIELKRILRAGGRLIVTVPNGDPKLLANRIKWRIGMTPKVYGHTRAGYTLAELRDAVSRAGFTLQRAGGYSRFFTEMVELAINYGYVNVLAGKKGKVKEGQIVPATSGELKDHGAAYRLYSLAFPFMQLISKVDTLLPARVNNAVIVEGLKSVSIAQ